MEYTLCLWSAPAERSGDGALAARHPDGTGQSGVALRLPPHSKESSFLAAVGHPADSSVHGYKVKWLHGYKRYKSYMGRAA
jgi:hypothetical protein